MSSKSLGFTLTKFRNLCKWFIWYFQRKKKKLSLLDLQQTSLLCVQSFGSRMSSSQKAVQCYKEFVFTSSVHQGGQQC